MAQVQVVLCLFLTAVPVPNIGIRQSFCKNSCLAPQLIYFLKGQGTREEFAYFVCCTLSEGRFLGGFCGQVVWFGVLRGGRAQRAAQGGWATRCCQMWRGRMINEEVEREVINFLFLCPLFSMLDEAIKCLSPGGSGSCKVLPTGMVPAAAQSLQDTCLDSCNAKGF